MLVDDDWQPAEPQLERLVELVACGGHHGLAEPEQSLFTCAACLAQGPKPTKRGRRNAPPASQSPFECAMEQ